ncbi:hypothetical protein SAMN02745248_01984 [Hathewaya proteolytica DSM 3090]|uniref:Uncharacterized protein n=1 Tax=Hathewaya proteolytica DSM 3090 TaxID=1121331 RepID=A0A1M6QE45_9CLOT|nr:hypothetical protein [Hathewaya proteolytica]SHK18347.1 hypothetical protein SAMN02745248_01984 [Hathewaya proteolytica DSM 3090]
MPTPDYKYMAIENFKEEGKKYQLKYDIVLQHIEDLYNLKCKCLDIMKETRNMLESSQSKDYNIQNIMDSIDTLCQTFRLEETQSKCEDYFKDVSSPPIKTLALKSTVDHRTLTSIPPVPYNCVALAYLVDNGILGKSKNTSNFNGTSFTFIGGKIMGKLFLGMLGPAGMAITGLNFLNKAIKKNAENMDDAMKISFLSSKLSEHSSTLDKIDMKLCCIIEELNSSFIHISQLIYVDKDFSKLLGEIAKLDMAFKEKI